MSAVSYFYSKTCILYYLLLYRCKLNAQASPRTMKRPPTKKKQEVEEIKEEIIVLRPEKKKQEAGN